jgi:predicted transposase YbfD/YdcC
MEGFAVCLAELDDPRTGNAGRHAMLEMLVIAICTLLTGGEDCTDMAEFAATKLDFLRGFLKLEHGAPSHDRFSRLFRLLDPEQFHACFQRFMAGFVEACRDVVAIDGKVLRRSFDTASGRSPLHMVSAWACEQQLVLGQVATEAKSNEITAVPKLLQLLSLDGGTVTVDALNCQRAIARQIVDQQGDYVMALKANQGTLHDDVRRFLDDPDSQTTSARPVVDGEHGWIETRTATVATDIAWLQDQHDWPGLVAIGKMHRARERLGKTAIETTSKTTTETTYYLLSAAMTAERFGAVARLHWGIENRLHWRLDVSMNEDQARNRLDYGPENRAVLRHVALNLLRKEPSKGSLPKKLRRAALSEAFLLKVLAQV